MAEAAFFVVQVFIFNVHLNICTFRGKFVFLFCEKLLWKGSLDPLFIKVGQCWQKEMGLKQNGNGQQRMCGCVTAVSSHRKTALRDFPSRRKR